MVRQSDLFMDVGFNWRHSLVGALQRRIALEPIFAILLALEHHYSGGDVRGDDCELVG